MNIKNRIAQKQVLRMQSQPKKSTANNVAVIFLSFCIVGLSIASFWAVTTNGGRSPLFADNSKTNKQIVKHYVKEPEKKSTPLPQVDQDKIKMESWMSDADKKLAKLDEQFSMINHRMWLFTIAHNENVNLTRQVQNRQMVPDPGYIVFDANWKLNKKPVTMKMTQEQLDSAAK